MLTFNAVLENLSVELARTLLVRQNPKESTLGRVLPWIAQERPDLYLAYHQVQWPTAERALARADRLISFIGHESGKGILAGAYTVGASSVLETRRYWDVPEHRDLAEHGMAGPDGSRAEMLRFALAPLPNLEECIGRIVVDWPPPARNWFRWADRQPVPLIAIHPDSAMSPPMPEWDQIVLSQHDLQLLPATGADSRTGGARPTGCAGARAPPRRPA